MQPKINSNQINTTLDGVWQQYQINAQTKTNTFQEVFIDGLCVAVYSADNTTNPDQFLIAGNFESNFLTGVVFHVAGSVGNDADYTTVADATYAAGYTTIYVTDGSITTNEGAGLGTGFINTGTRLVLPENSSSMVTVWAVARDTTTTGAVAGLIHRAVFSRDVLASSVARIGTVDNVLARESMTGTPDVDITADTTNGSIKFEFKGGSTNLVDWKAGILLQQLEV